MKSYTDLEQSKKLAKILPLESADICYVCGNTILVSPTKYGDTSIEELYKKHIIPCWSLAALLKLIPNFNIFKRTIECRIETTDHFIDKASDLIDVAFEMVCWLKENNKI